jgi:hypothetical protein
MSIGSNPRLFSDKSPYPTSEAKRSFFNRENADGVVPNPPVAVRDVLFGPFLCSASFHIDNPHRQALGSAAYRPSFQRKGETTMKRFLAPFAVLTLLLLAMANVAGAQGKVSGTNHCAKPDPQTTIQIGDRPNHALSVAQSKCGQTTPWEIAGIKGKEGIATVSGEIMGNTFRFHGYYVDEMANGDKAFYTYQGTATLKDGVTQTEKGTWNLLGGTGKLKGIKGKGTYTGKAGGDGTMDYDVQGDYEAPKK